VNPEKFRAEQTRQSIKNVIGVLSTLIYLALMLFLIFFFNAQDVQGSMILNQSVMISWGIQVFLDLAVYCFVKVIINYQLIQCYQTAQGSKRFLELLIDESIMNVYAN